MKRESMRHRPLLALGLIWVGLGFAGIACVAKPAFHCQSDAACVSSDGTRGTCEASGECTFRSALGDQGGANGVGDNAAGDSAVNVSAGTSGNASDDGGTSPGGSKGQSGSKGEIGAAGEAEAGASCVGAANDCYSCSPKTSEQFLNACTSAACVPFDDHARVTRISASGTLPPLPTPSGQ